ncbi:MAG: YceI family protein [Acidimicrobiia bacterium]
MADSVRYRISTVQSTVTLVGETSLHPITVNVTPAGWLEATVVDGTFEPDSEIAGAVKIAVIEFRSGNPLVDRETRRRLNAKRYPTINGEVTGVVALDGPKATVTGNVVFLGQEVELEGDISIADHSDDSLRLTGSGQMDVQWWGLEPPTLLVLKMEPVVTVSIDLVLEPVDRL